MDRRDVEGGGALQPARNHPGRRAAAVDVEPRRLLAAVDEQVQQIAQQRRMLDTARAWPAEEKGVLSHRLALPELLPAGVYRGLPEAA